MTASNETARSDTASASACTGIETDLQRLSLRFTSTTNATIRSGSGMMTMATGSPSDLYAQGGDDLDTFIAQTIQPTAQFLESCNEAVEQLVTYLQHNVPASLRPQRVIKGGSLCKGTAVLDKSDIDIVLMLNDYTDVSKLKPKLPTLLNELEHYLKKNPKITIKDKTPYAVQIEIRSSANQTYSADILPAVDVIDLRSSLQQVYKEMRGESAETRRCYSASLAPLQRQLFEQLPTKLKSLIRLVKYWKKEKCSGFYLPSYVLELVVLNAWCEAGRPGNFEMKRAVHAVLTSLIRHRDFRVVFPSDLQFATFNETPASGPYIMDPCNPFNNVYKREGLDRIATHAESWLHKSAFLFVTGTKDKW